MRIILDSNEYIIGLDTAAGPNAPIRLLELIQILMDESQNFRLFLPDIIVREVQRNLSADLEKDFFRLIHSSPKILHDSILSVPRELFLKYHREKGLKQADASIAAFADHMKVDYVVSENRHIYKELDTSAFVTLTAEGFLELAEG